MMGNDVEKKSSLEKVSLGHQHERPCIYRDLVYPLR